jgi:hypothetical protein
MPQAADDAAFEIDHIRSRKHDGPTVASNLYLFFYYCNSFQGSDLTSFDKQTRKITPLFNPCRPKGSKHFRWEGPDLIDLTPTGRVTVALLHINDECRVELRGMLIEEGVFPPA